MGPQRKREPQRPSEGVWSFLSTRGRQGRFCANQEKIRFMILKDRTFHVIVTLGLLFLIYSSCVKYIYIYICIHIYICVYIHTHTHIEIYKFVLCLWRSLTNT